MDLKQIKELIHLLEKSGLQKLTIKEKGMEISLEKGSAEQVVPVRREPVVIHSAPEPQQVVKSDAPVDDKQCVKSPMVGTFYRAPKPTDPPFAKEGDSVEVGQVICIVEAMKVMNEIKSNKKGKVTKVLVENGHPVEVRLLF